MMKMGWGDGETRRWRGSVQNGRLPPHYSATPLFCIYRFAPIVLPLSSDTIHNHCPPKDAPRIPSPSV